MIASSSPPLPNHAATAALHLACVRADERAVLRALGAGADVNALDSEGRSVLWLALLGTSNIDTADAAATGDEPARVAVLTALLKSPGISLMTLNAARVVTPLALAAWLNRPKSVLALLRDSDGAAAVDCMDAGGATPLMYAARDGSVDVARILLSHGARADLSDANDRTVVQHAIACPQVLWMAELALRRQRFRSHARKMKLMAPAPPAAVALQALIGAALPAHESSYAPPSASRLSPRALVASTRSVIDAVHVGNPDLLHSLLFPPHGALTPITLVNLADAQAGLAPLHYAVSIDEPSGDIIDALYRAGADMSLPTSDGTGRTPLHLFARHGHDGPGMYQLAIHLVHELRCPLIAKDAQGETPLHVAAEYGLSSDVLLAFLDCDVDGAVRDMPNSRGLLPREIAQPQYAALFAPEGRPLSTDSALTVRSPGGIIGSPTSPSPSGSGSGGFHAHSSLQYPYPRHQFSALPHVESSLSLSTTSTASLSMRRSSGGDNALVLKPEDATRAARAIAAALNPDAQLVSAAPREPDAVAGELAETTRLSLALISSWSARLDRALDEAAVLRASRERAGSILRKAREAHKERVAELDAAAKARASTVRKKSSFLSGLRLGGGSARSVQNVKSAPDLRASPGQTTSLMGALKGMMRGSSSKPPRVLEDAIYEEPKSPTSIRSPISPTSPTGGAPWDDPTPAVNEAVVKTSPKLFARMDADIKALDGALDELAKMMSRAHHAIASADASIEHAIARREDALLDLWFAHTLERPEHEFGFSKPLPAPPTPPKQAQYTHSTPARSHARNSSVSSSARSRSRSFTNSTAPTSLPASPTASTTSAFPHHRHAKLPSLDGLVTVAADGLPALLAGTAAALDAVEQEVERLTTWTRVARETIKAARRALVV
ncbi:hypothetical protein EXIGLDRAFT_707388 [Exidia glandulosa HHB12029]|uniref:Uncharacterized protein n=1 Tax=Exidia glandulosa HHB12029 TaxID=1314781 RepID=A0A165JVB0_EXIGL|nr:hypothetical protein EXIGLDRAFT_707388 [Exidia glandulosa HHB12029]